jgi:hypothetical protein
MEDSSELSSTLFAQFQQDLQQPNQHQYQKQRSNDQKAQQQRQDQNQQQQQQQQQLEIPRGEDEKPPPSAVDAITVVAQTDDNITVAALDGQPATDGTAPLDDQLYKDHNVVMNNNNSNDNSSKKRRVSASYGSRTTIMEIGLKRRSCICLNSKECNEIMTKWAKCNPSMYHYVQLPKLAGMDANGVNTTRNISDTELYKNQFRLSTLRYLPVKNPIPKDERIALCHYRECFVSTRMIMIMMINTVTLNCVCLCFKGCLVSLMGRFFSSFLFLFLRPPSP